MADRATRDDVDYANLVQLNLVTSWGEGIRVDQKLFNAWNQTPGLTPDTHLTSMFNWYRAIVPLLFGPLPAFDVKVPTLILWGSRDPILVEANVDRKRLEPQALDLEGRGVPSGGAGLPAGPPVVPEQSGNRGRAWQSRETAGADL